MTNNKLITKLLSLKGLHVSWVEFHNRNQELNLGVKPYKNGCRCPVCGRRSPIIRHRNEARSWRDLVVGKIIVHFWYSPKEINCPIHGRAQEVIPWAEAKARVTSRLEYALLVYCQTMTQKAAGERLSLPKSTASDILHRAVTRIRKEHKIRNLRSLGLDEIGYCKGKKYATIVYDIDKSCVVWVGKGKGRETIDKFFNEVLSEYQKNKIEVACCDMSLTYIGAIEDHCKNAILVLDHFHITKALIEAVDEVRKEQWREAVPYKRKALKGLRWLLFKHSSNRTKGNTRILNALRKGNRRIYRAWVLKDEFEQFWLYKSPKAAENFLKSWITSALRSRLNSLRGFANTLRTHMHRILPFVTNRITNAKAEGINRIIKIVKNRASGFRNLYSFIDLIFLTIGDLDIPAQIPAKFHSVR